jgi:hypothetical protein
MKEQLIRDYLSTVDFNGDWGLNAMRESMRKFLGEVPGIEVTYKKDVVLNESGNRAVELEFVKDVTVLFTDDQDKLKKITLEVLRPNSR